MYSQVSTRVILMTPKQAEGYLRCNNFPGQRKLDPDRVGAYASQMRLGTWTRSDIAMADAPDGQTYLMNGQHQCSAAIEAQVPVRAVVDHYRCQTPDDLWHLFGTFDMQKTRTERQVVGAARGLFASENLRQVPLGILGTCGAALLYLGSGLRPAFHVKPPNRLRRTELVQEHEMDVLRVAGYSAHARLLTIPVATAMIVTFRIDAGKAKEFWDRVLIGDDLQRSSAQWNLHRTLRGEVTVTRKQVGTNGRDRNAILYSICIKWWNNFITGQRRNGIKLAGIGSVKSVPDALGPKRSIAAQLCA